MFYLPLDLLVVLGYLYLRHLLVLQVLLLVDLLHHQTLLLLVLLLVLPVVVSLIAVVVLLESQHQFVEFQGLFDEEDSFLTIYQNRTFQNSLQHHEELQFYHEEFLLAKTLQNMNQLHI
jgi:hypothetical protein